MSKSRHMLVLSITTLFVLLLAATGWCGGPVDPSGSRAGADQAGPQGSPGATGDGAARGGGFSMSGGAGTPTVNGVDGASPYVSFASLMESGRGQAAFTFKASYVPKLAPDFRVTGQWITGGWGGWTASYSGPAHPILVNGLSAGCKLNLNIWTLRAEYDVNCYDAVSMGPRFELTQYSDTFTLVGPDTAAGSSETAAKGHSYSMLGLGLAGCINFNKLVGGGLAGLTPTLNFVATIGAGKQMEYSNWDVWVTVFKHKREQQSRWWPFSTSIWELGYNSYNFRFKGQRDDPIWVTAPDGFSTAVPSEDIKYKVGVPGARVTFAF